VSKSLFNSRGTAILEFAVILPVFLAVILGFINLVVLLNNDIVAQAAARDAASAAAVTGDVSHAIRRGQETLQTGGLGGGSSLSVESPRVGKERVTATVTYKVPVIAPGLGVFLGGRPWDGEVTLREETSYYVEYRHRTHYDRPEPECVGYWCKGGSDW